MTRDEIIKMAVFIQFPQPGMNWKDYSAIGRKILRVPMTASDFYGTYRLNEHHFPPMAHFNKTMPMLAKILKFNFSKDDFDIKEMEDQGHDLSMPQPKLNLKIDAICHTGQEDSLNDAPFEELSKCKRNLTPYHKVFRYFRCASTIINKTVKNGRRLFVSGDSHMIPVIPMMLPYFELITYSDNRDNIEFFDSIEKITYTDVLFQFYDKRLTYYTKTNLK